jgi:SAM-dependent methyltransferase
MTVSQIDVQRDSFDRLVEGGVYSPEFEHALPARDFVASVLADVLPRLDSKQPVRVLDCGCGTGAWLAFIAAELKAAGVDDSTICGFDLSGKMVEVAHAKLAGVANPDDLRVGNALEVESYEFASARDGFDLVFSYDVVQQLPRGKQFRACEIMVGQLSSNGFALIFDNDSQSKFGRRMGVRKFLTRYLGLRLVPRYYCNAAYPPLERYRRRLESAAWQTDIHIRVDDVKRSLVVSRPNDRGEAS